MEAKRSIISVRDVSRRFPGGVLALDDVSLDLLPGEIHALLGENGAGKSTLIKVMTGVVQPDIGDIYIDGEKVHIGSAFDAQTYAVAAIYQEPMVFPEPVISISVKPKDKGSVEKMGMAINKMVAEDPSFRVETDQESGETILKGMGELHLDIKVDILKRTHKVEVEVGKPQVAYRETITKAVEVQGKFVRQSGGRGQLLIQCGDQGLGQSAGGA